MGFGDWGSFLSKLIDKLPIADRKERIKNRINDLERQQKELTSGESTDKKIATYQRNKLELARLLDQLANLT